MYCRRRFECESCKKGFVSRRNLREHVAAVHTEEKPHACPECGRGFHKVGHIRLGASIFDVRTEGLDERVFKKCPKFADGRLLIRILHFLLPL